MVGLKKLNEFTILLSGLDDHGLLLRTGNSSSSPVARRKKMDFKDDALARLESRFFLHHLQCWRVQEGPLLRMSHTDGSKMSSRVLKSRLRSSNLENKIIHNAGCESLRQFIRLWVVFQIPFLPLLCQTTISLYIKLIYQFHYHVLMWY